MAGDVDIGGVTIPVLGVIWLASLVVIVLQYFGGISFGIIGLVSWLVFLAGAASFIFLAISHFR